MNKRLKTLLVAMVTLALLAAPCLTVFGPLGVGTVHAAGYAGGEAGLHDHHHADQNDHSLPSRHASKDNVPPAEPTGDRLPCCCNCDGWITADPVTQPPAVAQTSNPQTSKYELLCSMPVVQTQMGLMPERCRPDFAATNSLAIASQPAYALTGRLRL